MDKYQNYTPVGIVLAEDKLLGQLLAEEGSSVYFWLKRGGLGPKSSFRLRLGLRALFLWSSVGQRAFWDPCNFVLPFTQRDGPTGHVGLQNKASDKLAAFGSLNNRTMTWLGSGPPEVLKIVAEDCNETLIE